MSTASNHHTGHTGPSAGGDRTWVLVVAATGWVVLTAVAVLMATGTWSVGQAEVGGSTPSPSQAPGTGPQQRPDDGSRAPSVPQQRGPLSPSPETDPRPAPRAGRDGLVYAGSFIALVPRQRVALNH